MSDKKFVNAALDRYFTTLTSQISAGDELKSAVNDLLARKESPDAQKPGNLDEWDDLDQSYISIKLQNAFSEIENRAVTLENNVMKLRTREKETFWLETSAEEVITLVFALVKELHQYHKAVADCLAPLVEYSVYRERYPTKYEMKECSSVPVTWKAVNEVNRSLRYGYGLSKEDLASILSWKHGEDLSESTRKALNQRVDSLIQTYKERLSNLDTCEVDVPIAFQLYPLVLQDILKDCCSPVESIAAVGQIMPDKKEDLDTLILREIPRIQLKIGDDVHEVASPGKAFENTKQKMHAVRHLVTKAFKSQRHQVSKEQLDLFSLKVLATACISVANASSRTAVLMAFGKANLIQVKPSSVKLDDQLAQINLDNRSIVIEVPSQWCLVEDSVLLGSLPRDINCTMPIAIVDTVYRGSFDIKAEIEKRAQSLPLVRIQRCSGMMKNQDKKDQPSKGIRKRLSRATHKLFNRRSTSGIPQKTSPKMSSARDHVVTSAGIVNLAANILDNDKDIGDMDVASKSGAESNDPVPPPRPRRKARKKRKSENARKQQREIEEAKHDPKWFSSCRKLQAPEPVQNKMASNSLSVASFEELQEVIDFLSGSSTSSLCLSQQLDADKGGLKRSVATKQAQSTLGIDDKGKISPSDSGIGSTMSMRSHASVASISTFSSLDKATNNHAGMLKTGISDENSRIILNKDGKLQIESSCEDENDNDDDEDDEGCTIALENKLAFEAHEDDSRFEDAEVEHYIRKSSSCLQLVGERGRKLKGASEDPCKTPTVTPTSSMSSENDKETSVQDVIDDLKAMGFQNSDLDATSCQNEVEGDGDQQKGLHEACCRRATSEAEPDVESAVASDHHSYDADGSEESEESNPQPDEQPKAFPSNSLRGSTESLYYSAWELNEFATDNEANSKEQAATKIDHQTDSFFSDGLKETGLKESGLKETGITESGLSEILEYPESLQECEQQPPDMLYQHFNPRTIEVKQFSEQFSIAPTLASTRKTVAMNNRQDSCITTKYVGPP
eukprot:gene18899-20801_t